MTVMVLNERDYLHLYESMSCLSHSDRDNMVKMHTSFRNVFSSKGTTFETKPLIGWMVIQFNDIYVRPSALLNWWLHPTVPIYRKTVLLGQDGCLHPNSKKWAIPIGRVESKDKWSHFKDILHETWRRTIVPYRSISLVLYLCIYVCMCFVSILQFKLLIKLTSV